MVAAELARIRERLDITQAQMAQRFGVSLRTYIRWEHGEVTPKAGAVELARRWVAELDTPKRKKRGA